MESTVCYARYTINTDLLFLGIKSTLFKLQLILSCIQLAICLTRDILSWIADHASTTDLRKTLPAKLQMISGSNASQDRSKVFMRVSKEQQRHDLLWFNPKAPAVWHMTLAVMVWSAFYASGVDFFVKEILLVSFIFSAGFHVPSFLWSRVWPGDPWGVRSSPNHLLSPFSVAGLL